MRALIASADEAFKLQPDGRIEWRETTLAKLLKSDQAYAPRVVMADADLVTTDQMARMQERVEQFIKDHVNFVLAPLMALENPVLPAPTTTQTDKASEAGAEVPQEAPQEAPTLSGAAKGIAFQLFESFGCMPAAQVQDQVRGLAETDKPLLAKLGIRLGVETIYMADMLKPAPIKLRAILWSVHHATFPEQGPPPEGRVSIDMIEGVPDAYWLVTGYRRVGTKVMRVDMVERVSALVRAAARAGTFKMSDDMLSLAGVSREEMKAMILDLGCRLVSEEPSEDPEKPAIPVFERVRRKKAAQNGKRPPQVKGKSAHGGKGKPSAHRSGKGKAAVPKQPDPNSPFAVLASLKK